MKIGVFDSGIGGEAIALSLGKTFPEAELIVINDSKNIPYGNKTADQVAALTDTAIQPLLSSACDIIVLACNTATALAIDSLREKYPHQQFIGIEPMVKTASQLTKSNIVAVFATPATLSSQRYKKLVEKFGQNITIIEPDCSQWAQMIENNQINFQTIDKTIEDVCSRGADVIVLGCTHYHWIKKHIVDQASGKAQVIEPSESIGNRVKQLLKLS